jgi:isoleucyl-tRNA synthetase
MLGNSLEARVRLQARGELAQILERHRGELPSLFIVSQVELSGVADGAGTPEDLPGLRIEILKAEGEKCERCWNYRTDRGKDPQLPTLCGRCAPIVAALLGSREP